MAQDQKTRFDIKLPSTPSADDPALQAQLQTIYTSIRLLANQVEVMHKRKLNFGATMSIGTLVSIYDAGGGLTACVPAGYGLNECHGIVTTAATIGLVGEIMLLGVFDLFTGLTGVGAKLWVSATPGVITGASPGAGSQRIGYILSATEIWFDPMFS